MTIGCEGLVMYRVAFEGLNHQRFVRQVGVTCEMGEKEMEDILKQRFPGISHVLTIDDMGECLVLNEVKETPLKDELKQDKSE